LVAEGFSLPEKTGTPPTDKREEKGQYQTERDSAWTRGSTETKRKKVRGTLGRIDERGNCRSRVVSARNKSVDVIKVEITAPHRGRRRRKLENHLGRRRDAAWRIRAQQENAEEK
jgi:hypothetical protein